MQRLRPLTNYFQGSTDFRSEKSERHIKREKSNIKKKNFTDIFAPAFQQGKRAKKKLLISRLKLLQAEKKSHSIDTELNKKYLFFEFYSNCLKIKARNF